MKYQVIAEVEAKDGEDACFRILGWTPKFVKEVQVIENGVTHTYRLQRCGYEEWEPCWREVKGD